MGSSQKHYILRNMKLRLAKKIYKDAEIKNNICIHNVDRLLFSNEWSDLIFPTLHSDEEIDNYLDTRFPYNYRYNSFMFNKADIRIGQWHRRDSNNRLHLSIDIKSYSRTKNFKK